MNTKQLLIIDDEEDIREVTRMSLELVGGWNVHTTNTISQAFDIAKITLLDAILLDVMMPDIDGFQAFKMLRGNSATANVPVIFLTAKINLDKRSKLAELNTTGIISKPFNPLTLPTEISKILGWHHVEAA